MATDYGAACIRSPHLADDSAARVPLSVRHEDGASPFTGSENGDTTGSKRGAGTSNGFSLDVRWYKGILFARNGRFPQNPRISSSGMSYIIYCAVIRGIFCSLSPVLTLLHARFLNAQILISTRSVFLNTERFQDHPAGNKFGSENY